MKKILLAAMTVLLLLLSACQSPADPAESPSAICSPQPTQFEDPSPDPAPSADPVPSPPPGVEAPVLPQFLKDFSFRWVDTLVPEGSILQYITYQLTPEDRDNLKAAIAMDTWWEATDVPAMGLEGNDTFYDEDGHTLVPASWDEEKCLILVKENSETYLYYAPITVLDTFNSFLADKALLPNFIHSFEMDQIEVDRTPYEDRESYKDFDVYLLSDTERASFLAVLAPDTWTVARGNEPAIMYSEALRARDQSGNHLNLAPWDEEKCLVNCFFADGGSVARYWAPASVLKNAQDLVDGLTSLGTIDNTAARYYDLFWSDPGFDALFELADKSGRISDDQMAAYALVRLAYEGSFDSEVGVSTKTIDRFTQTYFGRVVNSYDTSMSKTLPSGNVTPTGWDIGGSRSLVLTGTPEEDEYGNISATFLVYVLGEEAWIDGTMDPVLLDHIREYVLTGNTDEYPDPIQVSVTFRIDTDHWYGVPREYLVYDAVRREYSAYSAGV